MSERSEPPRRPPLAPTSASGPRPSHGPEEATHLTRRELLAGAGAGAAALVLGPGALRADGRGERMASVRAAGSPGALRSRQAEPVVFTHTTVADPDEVRDDVALAVEEGRIAAIGPTEEVLQAYPRAETYDGRGKALIPGLVNTHAHMAAVVARGFNEDFGFPNTQDLPVWPRSLLEGDEHTLMVQVAALEAIRTGTTTIVEYTRNIEGHAEALANTGLRCVFAEGVNDAENVESPISMEKLGRAEPPRFSARLRDEGLRRIDDLYTTWHGARDGRIQVFPAGSHAEAASPELLRSIREYAEERDLGYTIHLNQSRAEYHFMEEFHGLRPAEYLDAHDFLGPRLFAAHARYVNDREIAALGRTRTIIAHQAGMAANRGVSPPIPALRAAGCPIALGTDNNTNDVFEVMRIALLTERIRRNRDGDEVPGLRPQPEDILADAAQGGARAVRMEGETGTLEVGTKADLLVIDTRRAHLVPAGRFLSALIHCGHPGEIESVMVDGHFLIRGGEVLTMDEVEIVREAQAVGRRIWDRIEEVATVEVPRLPRGW